MSAKNSRVEFRLGSVFPPGSAVSRFLVRLAIIRNDLILTQRRTQSDYEKGDQDEGVSMHLLYVTVSHFREAAKVLKEELEDPAVQSFVATLTKETRDRLGRIEASFTPWKGSFVEATLKPIRDAVFHYPEAEEVEAALRELHKSGASIDLGEGRHIDIRYSFADELLVRIVAGHLGSSTEELEASLQRVATLTLDYVYFVSEATVTYFKRLNRTAFDTTGL